MNFWELEQKQQIKYLFRFNQALLFGGLATVFFVVTAITDITIFAFITGILYLFAMVWFYQATKKMYPPFTKQEQKQQQVTDPGFSQNPIEESLLRPEPKQTTNTDRKLEELEE